jgi:hypothetical protein
VLPFGRERKPFCGQFDRVHCPWEYALDFTKINGIAERHTAKTGCAANRGSTPIQTASASTAAGNRHMRHFGRTQPPREESSPGISWISLVTRCPLDELNRRRGYAQPEAAGMNDGRRLFELTESHGENRYGSEAQCFV